MVIIQQTLLSCCTAVAMGWILGKYQQRLHKKRKVTNLGKSNYLEHLGVIQNFDT